MKVLLARVAALCCCILLTAGVLAQTSTINYYLSTIDNSQQPYGIHIPAGYSAAVPHPVIFIGHGFGGHAGASFSTFQQQFAATNQFLLVQLEGRGNTFYDGVGEVDFFDVLADLRSRYTIDERRLYFEGPSMGATGAYRLGVRHPHVLAAVGGTDGWGDYRFWYPHWYGPTRDRYYVDPARLPNLLMASCVDVAEGAKWQNLFTIVDTNDTTVWPDNTYSLNDRLNALGLETPEDDYLHLMRTNPGGHTAGYDQPALYDYFLDKVLNPYPTRVTFNTLRVKYGKKYWASIDRLQTVNTFAAIDAVVTGNTVEVTVSNALQYTLTLDDNLVNPDEPVTILTNGATSYTGPAGDITLHATLDAAEHINGWSEENTLPGGLRKTATLEGPIGDAYTSTFLVVYGTIGSSADTAANLADADFFCGLWDSWFHVTLTPVRDVDVTTAQIAGSNLILFGTEESHSLLQQMATNLPIHVTNAGVTVGDRTFTGTNYGAYFIYPNPLNPAKYVVVSHQTVPGAKPKDLEALPWYWPDYVVFDTTLPAGSCIQASINYLPDTFVEAGYFDGYWKLQQPWQPDLLIQPADAAYLGNGVYNDLPTQTSSTFLASNTLVTCTVLAQNDGLRDDDVTLTAVPDDGLTITVTDVATGDDVTSLVTGGWSIHLPARGEKELRVTLQLAPDAPDGTAKAVLFTAVSTGDDTKTDAVQAGIRLNAPAAASDDSYSTPEDTALSVSAPGVLGNDQDPDGDALTASVAQEPAHGMLTLNANGSFVYTPAVNYIGDDNFTYRANDGTATSTASVSLTITSTGSEGDVAGRPHGDGSLTSSDVTQTGRFIALLDPVYPDGVASSSSEFMRADCAPRGAGGDGLLTVADWVQAARYALGLDARQNTAGPRLPGAVTPAPTSTKCIVRAGKTSIHRGRTAAVPLYLGAKGTVNALGGTLTFDSTKLELVSVRPGSNMTGAALVVNTKLADYGRLGFALMLPAGQAFPKRTHTVLHVIFRAKLTASPGFTTVGFTDTQVRREVVDPTAAILPATFLNGAVRIGR
ncbi:MAG: Ig-like domain-containing protein [Armatimonadota bacterium]